MKSIVLPGEKTEAPCEICGRFQKATWGYGPVALEGLVVEQVMRATCDVCGQVLATAHQSAYLFKRARRNQREQRTTFRVPQELRDYVALQLDRAGAPILKPEIFLRALLAACQGREDVLGPTLPKLEDPVLARPCSETVTLTLRRSLRQTLEKLQQSSGIRNGSELVRRLLVWSDSEGFHPSLQEETQRLILAMAG